MLTYQKNLTFHSYTRWALNSLWTSQFLFLDTNRTLRLRTVTCSLQHRKSQKLHYFYLMLLTKKTPYLHKFSLAETKRVTPFLKNKGKKKQLLHVHLQPKQQAAVLREVLWYVMAKRINNQTAAWTYDQTKIQFTIPSVPLTPKTLPLQAPNSYFPDFALSLKFDLPFTTAFQKLFFLRMVRFLSPALKVKSLDS